MRKRKPVAAPLRGDLGCGLEVTAVPVEATPMVTVWQGDLIWITEYPWNHVPMSVSGAFVRLDPPPGVSASRIEEVRKLVLGHAALAVKVLSSAQTKAVPENVRDALPHQTARATVRQLVEKASTEDREALAELCEKTMDEEGL
jgi:hypothetical protein